MPMTMTTRKRAREKEAGPVPIPTRKKAGIEKNSEDPNTSGETDGDIEVFRILIPITRNLKVLKICRLVCKSWNQFACAALRNHPRFYYPVNEDYRLQTASQLHLIEENVRLGLPSPFGVFKVDATFFKGIAFPKLLKYLRESTSDNFLMELRISSYDVDQSELQTLLTCNQNNLKIVKLTLIGPIININGRDGNIFQPEVIRLPFLRTLRILDDSLTDERVVSLCENICRYSPLQSLTIGNHGSGKALQKVMSSASMRSITKLRLNFSKRISLGDWNYITARIVQIQSIKKLSIHAREATISGGASCIEAIIGHFADTLEYLAGDCLPRFNGKAFPKLREIKYTTLDIHELQFYYPAERYPLLRNATFGRSSFKLAGITDELNQGIEELFFTLAVTSSGFGMSDHEAVLKIISLAGWRFPNVSNFSFDYSGGDQFTSAMLKVIWKSFPNLRALELRVNLKDSMTLSGLRPTGVEWLQEGWPLEKIPREASLLNLRELEKLTLGPEVIISRHMFLYCLSKIQKLQDLTFYLNGDVSATDVRDSVGHLAKIAVLQSINPKKKWVQEMKRLQIMLPGVIIVEFLEKKRCGLQ